MPMFESQGKDPKKWREARDHTGVAPCRQSTQDRRVHEGSAFALQLFLQRGSKAREAAVAPCISPLPRVRRALSGPTVPGEAPQTSWLHILLHDLQQIEHFARVGGMKLAGKQRRRGVIEGQDLSPKAAPAQRLHHNVRIFAAHHVPSPANCMRRST